MAVSFSEIEGGLCAAKGFSAAAVYSGVRGSPKNDLVLILSDREAAIAGVFTRNLVRAWCVQHNIERMKKGSTFGIICSAGNANCSNGLQGSDDDLALQKAASDAAEAVLDRRAANIFTASTGVIGVPLPIGRIQEAAPGLIECLGSTISHNMLAAEGIMTTDLAPKMCAVEVRSAKGIYRIGGIAKGSGMIAPNMATMLGFITCDAEAEQGELLPILKAVTQKTFNCVAVDGDTSTNDMVLLLANGKSGTSIRGEEEIFEAALEHVCAGLATQIARDGEGATKLITIRLKDAPDGGEKIARTIAESPLVKTACFGNDPNWGRIIAAAGRSGIPFDPRVLTVRIAGYEVYRNGQPALFNEEEVSRAMKGRDLDIELDFGIRSGLNYRFWTCDLTYDYVRINAEYTT